MLILRQSDQNFKLFNFILLCEWREVLRNLVVVVLPQDLVPQDLVPQQALIRTSNENTT